MRHSSQQFKSRPSVVAFLGCSRSIVWYLEDLALSSLKTIISRLIVDFIEEIHKAPLCAVTKSKRLLGSSNLVGRSRLRCVGLEIDEERCFRTSWWSELRL